MTILSNERCKLSKDQQQLFLSVNSETIIEANIVIIKNFLYTLSNWTVSKTDGQFIERWI